MSFRAYVKKIIPTNLFQRIEPFGHLLEAIIENIIFGFPTRKLKVIGVTGTAGKTTTCTLITHMLRQSGFNVAMMTTISIDYGDGLGPQPNSTRMTSVGSLKLLQAAKRMKQNKVEWLVLETTSQALSQHRVWSVPYTIVAFTNLSHDNFNYHHTFARYRQAKLKLFKQCNRHFKGLRTGIVNIDDPNGKYFVKAIAHPITYGVKEGELRAENINSGSTGSSFTARISSQTYSITSNLPGVFNIYNTLAAIGVCRAAGLSEEQIEQGIASLKRVEGRMNSLNEGQDFGVIVDYACTPDGFREVFKAVKPLAKKRIITMFGSAGRRDELKRPIQGEIAGKNSDIIILTEEDDRDQDGQKILEEIATGVEKTGKTRDKDMLLIHDREEAVKKAISLAKAGDLVLLLGKGEEREIITNKPGFEPKASKPYNEATDTIRRQYNDTETAIRALKELVKR